MGYAVDNFVVQCGEGVGDALGEGGYVVGKCNGWEGLG